MLQLTISEVEQFSRLVNILADRRENGVQVVGIFDSGAGGLTVIPALNSPTQLCDLYYRGDTAHFPYGEKSEVELLPLVLADVDYLVQCGCSCVGIACNTASIIWRSIVGQLPTDVQKRASKTIIDTISCTVQALVELHPLNIIGIIGTNFTVQSGAYQFAIKQRFPDAIPIILQSAEQTLVNAIERGEKQAIERELARILAYFGQYQLDVFILGCTHYGHLTPIIAASLPKSTKVLDPSILLGQSLRDVLAQMSVQRKIEEPLLHVSFTGETPANCVY